MTILRSIILAAYFALLVFAGHKTPQPPACAPGPHAISLDSRSWTISGAFYGKSQSPTQLANGGFYLNFPDHLTGKYVGYLTTSTCSIYGASVLTATLQVLTTGAPVFMYDSEIGNACPSPSKVRAYFQSGGPGEFDRWWANPISYQLAAGMVTLTVPLTPDQWSSLYGRLGNFSPEATAGFIHAQQNPQLIGFTFGGGCFFGHGVDVLGGTAQFQLLNYEAK